MSHTPPQPWTGRIDGDGPEHARWHSTIQPLQLDDATHDAAAGGTAEPGSAAEPGTVLLGFASDEGVRRNQGRVGAAEGPQKLREMLASMAIHSTTGKPNHPKYDAGNINVTDGDLETGQAAFGEQIATLLGAGHFTVGLGGGHEIAYASYLGVAEHLTRLHDGEPFTLGVLNLDAHFDLREAEQPTSGTGFLQMHHAETAAGRKLHYGIVGISSASNTNTLFRQAKAMGAESLLDTECGHRDEVTGFIRDFSNQVDHLYLTIDLDVLPAATAPGVSAPAGYGVDLPTIHAAALTAARSKKLVHLDIAELNPSLDIDNRTARTAARLIDDIVRAHENTRT
ncbi:formimidoylglutamase [Pseudoglutamicibacter cumminsii]|uniref:formimidoylglutamase n=1 Tax=Pseudoglutamicibacter cumminsii TaxID=156979 RepID=UPI002554BB7E|nr:formimidoylglutamase [Pseudoglutamicibacter cumminsii]MDK7083184.1 formimidoylglutamase [Pseudoglutamicibacter cumminsii]